MKENNEITARVVFSDPVGYLSGFGLVVEVVEPTLPQAA